MAPVHPAVVHFPMAFLISAAILDLLTHAAQSYPTAITPLSDLLSVTTRSLIQHTTLFSHALNIAGLLTAIPAVITGGIQANALMSSRGTKSPAAKVLFPHAALMDVSILASAWNWWSRRGVDGYMSAQVNGAVSAGVLGLIMLGASLGGSLVYDHGIGVHKAREGKKTAAAKKEL